MEPILEDLYYNTKNNSAFSGTDKLYEAAKKVSGDIKISRSAVKKWLSAQESYTLFRDRLINKYPSWKYYVHQIDQQWSIDLADMQAIKDVNDGFRYLLCVIDVFSKFAWVKPVKTKNAVDVAKAMKEIFTESGRQPLNMNGDAGSEFVNIKFEKMLKDYGVHYFISYGKVKAAVVERFIRTLKTHIWRYFKHFNTQRYIDVLDDFIVAYNHSKHRTIGIAPAEVTLNKSFSIWKKAFNPLEDIKKSQKSRPKYKVNDIVRISTVKGVFEKGYVGTFSEEYYVITKVVKFKYPFGYKINHFDSGEAVNGIFYEPELQKITFSKNQLQELYDVEKVLKVKQINGIGYSFVKFVGFPQKFNRWIPSKSIINS
jgi:transposase InsO family protein